MQFLSEQERRYRIAKVLLHPSQVGPVALRTLIKILLKQDIKKGSAKEITGFCAQNAGSYSLSR